MGDFRIGQITIKRRTRGTGVPRHGGQGYATRGPRNKRSLLLEATSIYLLPRPMVRILGEGFVMVLRAAVDTVDDAVGDYAVSTGK